MCLSLQAVASLGTISFWGCNGVGAPARNASACDVATTEVSKPSYRYKWRGILSMPGHIV